MFNYQLELYSYKSYKNCWFYLYYRPDILNYVITQRMFTEVSPPPDYHLMVETFRKCMYVFTQQMHIPLTDVEFEGYLFQQLCRTLTFWRDT
jgi:hypothetical protein